MMRFGASVLIALVAVVTGGCFEFHLVGPEDPPEVVSPALVPVQIVYRQPEHCSNVEHPCDGNVVFFGSWMREGAVFSLTSDATSRLWRGTALGVPVNFPPSDDPYAVSVYDPYLHDTSSAGMTAYRLTVGDENVSELHLEGTPNAHGLIFIDANGRGHDPY